MEYDPDFARQRLDASGAMESPCAACGSVSWRVASALSGLPVVDLKDRLDLELFARVVPVVCMVCGNARFHDWNLLSE